MSRVAPRAALALWLRIGCTSFGGPVAQIDLMHREVVERRGWVDERSFLHALRLCNALPGPEAQQLACWLGWRVGGLRGGNPHIATCRTSVEWAPQSARQVGIWPPN